MMSGARLVPFGCAAVDAVLIVAIAGLLLHDVVPGVPARVAAPGVVTAAALFALFGALWGDYSVTALLRGRGAVVRVARAWGLASGGALAAAILAGVCGGGTGRAGVLLALAGLPVLTGARVLMARQLRGLAKTGIFAMRRTMVVGTPAEVDAYLSRHAAAPGDRRIVGTAVLRDKDGDRAEDLTLALAIARVLVPAEVVVAQPWDDPKGFERTVEAMRQLPAAIHLVAPDVPGRFNRRATVRPAPTVELVATPQTALGRGLKRAMDVAAAGCALVLLSPVLLGVALAIRLDSRGPILFRQRRYGFNQQPFRIYKFRSMRTMEDGAAVRQVTDGDARVTRVGRILRRTSLDELPQLINVLTGDMSLIGPRPHAIAHDHQFERVVQTYGRRFAVRPGITGWAQVSGYRGETDTPEKIQGRVQRDLAYVDNWSLWFDITILLRTVLSPRTFQNAK